MAAVTYCRQTCHGTPSLCRPVLPIRLRPKEQHWRFHVLPVQESTLREDPIPHWIHEQAKAQRLAAVRRKKEGVVLAVERVGHYAQWTTAPTLASLYVRGKPELAKEPPFRALAQE